MICNETIKTFCKDDISKIENYEQAINDTSKTWECHHRLELTINGEFAHTKEELIRLGMYYNRPYFELIFLPKSEHTRLHMKSKALSENVKNTLSTKRKGRKPNLGKHWSLSDEAKRNHSISMKNKKKSTEHKRKISETLSGRTLSAETKKKISESMKMKNKKG